MSTLYGGSTSTMASHTRSGELTIREMQVLALVAEGLSNKEIARKINTTTGTANGHVHNIIRKLNVANRTQAATWALSHGVGNGHSYGVDNGGGGRVAREAGDI